MRSAVRASLRPLAVCFVAKSLTWTVAVVALLVNRDPLVDSSWLYDSKLYGWRFLLPLANWDGEYFLHMAGSRDGPLYGEVHSTAFFPGFPALVRFLKPPFLDVLETGLLLNAVLHVVACQLLYRWLWRRTNTWNAFIGVALYCLGPNAIFQIAFYNHNLFDCLTFGAALLLDYEWTWAAAVAGGLATMVRSNGVLFLVPLFFHILCTSPFVASDKPRQFILLFEHWLSAASQASIVVGPYLAMLGSGFEQFCHGGRGLSMKTLATDLLRGMYNCIALLHFGPPEGTPSILFCKDRFPSIYSFIQSEFWQVKWFGYWRTSKLDRFVVSGPVYVLVFMALYRFAKTRKFTFWRSADVGHLIAVSVLTTLLLCKFNVEIVARVLSSQPLLMWALSEWAQSRPSPFLLWWCFMLHILGVFMFVFWMPYT